MSIAAEPCAADEVRTELDRIVSSANFLTSKRNRRFLEYVVDETLEGRGDRLKAYNIATSVFGRPDYFDPQTDPVVRMEAGRLRRALERFYLTEGGGAVQIGIPKGGYQVDFKRPSPTRGTGWADRTAPQPSILVAPFDVGGDPEVLLHLNLGFALQVIIALHRLGEPVASGSGLDCNRAALASAGGALYVLAGDVAIVRDWISVNALLVEMPTHRVLWGESHRRHLPQSKILVIRDEIAEEVSQALHEFMRSSAKMIADDRPATAISEAT